MKVTRAQLQQIIKEEKRKVLLEIGGGYRHPQTGESLFLMLNDAVDKLLDQGMDTVELANELRGLADDVEASGPMVFAEGDDDEQGLGHSDDEGYTEEEIKKRAEEKKKSGSQDMR